MGTTSEVLSDLAKFGAVAGVVYGIALGASHLIRGTDQINVTPQGEYSLTVQRADGVLGSTSATQNLDGVVVKTTNLFGSETTLVDNEPIDGRVDEITYTDGPLHLSHLSREDAFTAYSKIFLEADKHYSQTMERFSSDLQNLKTLAQNPQLDW